MSDLRQLKEKYHTLFENGEFQLPMRYQLAQMQHPDYLKNITQSYLDNPQLVQQDVDIVELLNHYDRGHALAVQFLLNPTYRKLPDYMKFPIEEVMNLEFFTHSLDSVFFHSLYVEGIVIANHKFVSNFKETLFNYEAYVSYFRDKFYTNDVAPRLHVGASQLGKELQLRDEPYIDDAFSYLKKLSFLPIQEIWAEFKKVNFIYSDNLLMYAHEVARDLESGTAQCFSFGQFIQVLPLLRGMKKVATRNSLFNTTKPSKFCNFIYDAELVCSSCFTSEQTRKSRSHKEKSGAIGKKRAPKTLNNIQCEARYEIVIDRKHSMVFIKQIGKHVPQCLLYQQTKGYSIMKRHIVLKAIGPRFNPELMDHYGWNTISMKNKDKWF